MNDRWWSRALRVTSIVLMSLTAAFTLLGGAGTTCVALNPTGFGGKFAGLAPFQWLYILFVLVTLAIGVLGVRAVVRLIRGRKNAYRDSVVVLALGLAVGAAHMAASRALRGASMPVDMVVYTTLLTLILLLLLCLPPLRQRVRLERAEGEPETGQRAAALAAVACGLLALIIPAWMAPTHTIGGVNYASVWRTGLTAIGLGLIAAGLFWQLRDRQHTRNVLPAALPDPTACRGA